MKISPAWKHWFLLIFSALLILLLLINPTQVYSQDERPLFTADECLPTQGNYVEDERGHQAGPGSINCNYYKVNPSNAELQNWKKLYVIFHPSPEEALTELQERFLTEDHLDQFSCETYNDCDRVERVLLERTDHSFYGYEISKSSDPDNYPDFYSLERRYASGNYNVTIFVQGELFSDLSEAMAELDEIETMAKAMTSQPREMVTISLGNENSNSNENSNENINENANENSNENINENINEISNENINENDNENTSLYPENTVDEAPLVEETPEVTAESAPDAQALAELYYDLTVFLAGEGITAPTPGQVAVGGVALTTLLGGWLLLNLLSGTPAETSLAVIAAWQNQGALPGQSSPADTTELPQEPETTPEPAQPDKTGQTPPPGIPPTADVPADQGLPKPQPPGPTTEESVLQNIKNVQDLDDAVKQTHQDFNAFIDKVPANIRNSHEWQTLVEPKLDEVKGLMQGAELDQTRTWVDRVETLINLRNDIEKDLAYLPADSQEAIVWTERTLRTLGHFASDAYQGLVIEPAKNAGGAILPSELSEQWNAHMDELGQSLSDVAQQIGELPRQGTRLLTHGNLQDQAADMMQSTSEAIQQEGQQIGELYQREDVEYPDFWGKGTDKVNELWNNTVDNIFN